jgi:hypothetical protein
MGAPSIIGGTCALWSKFVRPGRGMGVVSRCGGRGKKILENAEFVKREYIGYRILEIVEFCCGKAGLVVDGGPGERDNTDAVKGEGARRKMHGGGESSGLQNKGGPAFRQGHCLRD